MAHDYIPRRDAEFLQWSRVFSETISADPTSFGLTAAQAAEYASLHNAYADAFQTSFEPATRTAPAIVVKNETRSDAEAYARLLVRIVQATPIVTDEQRSALSITVRDRNPSPVPRPNEAPHAFVDLVRGSTVRVRLRSEESPRRSKPEGVAGAMIYSFVGDTPPDEIHDWAFNGATTRTTTEITFGDGIQPGARVWITACWFNPRAQRGPAAQPASTYIQCPTLLLRAAEARLAA